MSGARIADQKHGEAAPSGISGARTSGAGERFGAALASPIGILLVVPGLVAVVGLFLTLLGQTALRKSARELGRDRFAEQTDFIARSIAASLAQADPLLDRMHALAATWRSTDPPAPIAHELRGLMQGRPGIAYASVSYPDGTFQGAHVSDDGVIRFKELRWTRVGAKDRATMTLFDFRGTNELTLRSADRSLYDPRTRNFYRRAVEARHRIWTRPYPFFESRQTGVTRAEPVHAPDGTLLAVLTADFDVTALSASMAHTPLPGARTLLYTQEGTLLAHPEGANALARLSRQLDRLVTSGDLGDPLIEAFFAAARGQPAPGADFTDLSVAGEAALAMVRPVPDFPELGWSVAAIVPQAAFFRARIEHERQSMVVSVVSLLAALGVAVVFSRHVVRVRRAVAVARDIARKATDRAKELGSYRLVERLGHGGMGEVWRAEHRLLVRHAAIKLIHPEALASTRYSPVELRERFRREAQTLATLRSRHTIELFDYGVAADGTFFFVMELLDGMDLDTLVSRHGPQPAARVIHLLVQACSSLAEAHHAGLVHRDVKPANMFLCRAADEVDVVKVLDFGLVQAATLSSDLPALGASASGDPRLTGAGRHLGTPAFMAPEQVRAEQIDGRADLYSLACVAIWLLTGRMPFEADTAIGVMSAHLYSAPPELVPLVPGYLPGDLELILKRCLQKAPQDRPPDAAALAAALRAITIPAEQAWTAARAQTWWAERIATTAVDLRRSSRGLDA
jgi:serine/threonine protein kinase